MELLKFLTILKNNWNNFYSIDSKDSHELSTVTDRCFSNYSIIWS